MPSPSTRAVIGVVSSVVVLVGGVLTWLWIVVDRDPARAPARLELVRVAFTILLGTGGLFGLYLAWRRQRSTEVGLTQKERDQADVARAYALQERSALASEADAAARRITDLYTKAVEQLGSDKAPVRLGGLYALERLAQDHTEQRQTIVNVLCAYLRMPYTAPGESPADEDLPEPGDYVADVVVNDRMQHLVTEYGQRVEELEVRNTAQRILATHLRPGSDPDQPLGTYWERIDLDLTGACLVDIDLSGCRFRTVRLSKAQFIGAADLRETTFDGAVNFSNAVFKGQAQFHGAQLLKNAVFDDARFMDDAWFRGVLFSEHVSFYEALFFKGALFRDTGFAERAWFDGAQFKCAAEFGGATFGPIASFGSVEFSESADFRGSRFDGAAEFEKAQFKHVVWFKSVSFAKGARFGSTVFGHNARFDGAQFSADATFGGAHFLGTTRFNGSHFAEKVSFDKCRFDAVATFKDVVFDTEPSFNDAEFKHGVPPEIHERNADDEATSC
jgi:uncharacterized protein YjbI with pentapeptide repeats